MSKRELLMHRKSLPQYLVLTSHHATPVDAVDIVGVTRLMEIKFNDGLLVTTREPVEVTATGGVPLPAIDYSTVESMRVEYEVEWPNNLIETIPTIPTTIVVTDD